MTRGKGSEIGVRIGTRSFEESPQYQYQHRLLLLLFLSVVYRSYRPSLDRIRGLVSQVEAEVGAEAEHRGRAEVLLIYPESDAGSVDSPVISAEIAQPLRHMQCRAPSRLMLLPLRTLERLELTW